MDSLDVAKVCLRRWYVFIPVLLIALAAGYRLSENRQPTYTADAGFLVYFNPPQQQPQTDNNRQPPPQSLNPIAAELVPVLVADLSTVATQDEIMNAGGTAPYTVGAARGSRIITVSATSHDKTEAFNTVTAVLAAAEPHIKAVQGRAGAPPQSYYRTLVTTVPEVAITAPPAKTKLMLAFGGIGVLAGAAFSLLLERMLSGRRRRKSRLQASIARHGEQAALLDDDVAALDLDGSRREVTSGGSSG